MSIIDTKEYMKMEVLKLEIVKPFYISWNPLENIGEGK